MKNDSQIEKYERIVKNFYNADFLKKNFKIKKNSYDEVIEEVMKGDRYKILQVLKEDNIELEE